MSADQETADLGERALVNAECRDKFWCNAFNGTVCGRIPFVVSLVSFYNFRCRYIDILKYYYYRRDDCLNRAST